MPKFTVEITFDLTTEIEPEISRYTFDSSNEAVTEFADNSYMQRNEVRCDGGSLSCIITAESEERAQEIAAEILTEGQEVEDDSGLTWLIENVSVEVEEIEEPMTKEEAVRLVTEFINSMEGMDERLRESFRFLLNLV